MPGASEINGVVSKIMPAKNMVGATFLNEISTVNNISADEKPFVLSSWKGSLMFESLENGQVSIHDITGKSVKVFQVVAFARQDKQIGEGLFLVRFYSDLGKSYAQKIIL